MPRKPDPVIVNAASKKLDSQAVVLSIINENPELRQAALDAKLVREVKPTEKG